MKGGSFLLRCLAEIPSRMVQVLFCGMLPPHLRFALKHREPGQNPGQCFALKCGHFSVGVFGICFQTIQYCHNPSNRQVGTWRCRWIPILIQISTCKTLSFFAVAVGFLLEGRVALLNLPSLDAAILVKLVQSQQRVKGYWIWIQSQSSASSVWAQADVQCLLEDAHRIVRPTCLDGAFWSQNKENVSNHHSSLSLGGICSHKFHSGMSPSVNIGTCSLWLRLLGNVFLANWLVCGIGHST